MIGTLAVASAAQRSPAQDFGSRFGGTSVHLRRTVAARRPLSRLRAREANVAARKPAEVPVSGPLFAVLSLPEQHISLYNGAGLVTRSKVSTGMAGHRTPTGIFSIIGRERWHRSNIYSGAPMPFMQRITWSGVALHLGVVPGYPASHGCIRLPAGFAQKLWGMTKIGERVVVTPHEVTPAPIVHPKLPLPKMQPGDGLVADDAAAARAMPIAAAPGMPATAAATADLLNPIAYAQLLKARAAADAAAATTAVKEAGHIAVAKADAARRAAAQLRAAEADHARAEDRLNGKRRASDGATTPEAKAAAAAATSAAETQVREAADKLQEVSEAAAAQAEEARSAERVLEQHRAALARAQALAKEAARRASPVSVLVSKKDKRIYVRQGLAPVLEASAVIRDPDSALGTHLYLATGLQADGRSLAWTAISLPAPSPPPVGHSHRPRQVANPAHTGVVAPSASSAAEALDRIDIPAEIGDRLSELLWTGASLIISDRPLSDETGDLGTDIVVTVR